jgi:hypothetical protein
MKHGFKCLIFFVSISAGALAADPVETKLVSVNEMMDNSLRIEIPVKVPVPAKYKIAQLKNANFGYTYWLRPEDVKEANASQRLPAEHGSMYAKITANVGYDQRRNLFIGLEEPEYQQQAKQVLKEYSLERRQAGGHQIVLLKATAIANDTRVYGMYVATNIDTNVVYIAYTPERNSQEVGDFVWHKLRETLSPSNSPIVGASSSLNESRNTALAAATPGAAAMKGASEEKTIEQFARSASEEDVNALFNSFASEPIRATGSDQLIKFLEATVVPFFAGAKLDGYSAVNGAQFEDGSTGNIHYMYIVTPAGKYRPFLIALRNENGKTMVMNIVVGQCVKNRHPKTKGRCD